MHPKFRKPMAIAALGASAIALDVAAWQGLSPLVSQWLASGPGRAVASAAHTVAEELGATAARRAGDLAFRLALRAARESGGLYALIQRLSPVSPALAGLPELPALPEPSVCVLASSVPLGPASIGSTEPRVILVVGRCVRSAATPAPAAPSVAPRFERMSLQTL